MFFIFHILVFHSLMMTNVMQYEYKYEQKKELIYKNVFYHFSRIFSRSTLADSAA